jgi:hypothetical protein
LVFVDGPAFELLPSAAGSARASLIGERAILA